MRSEVALSPERIPLGIRDEIISEWWAICVGIITDQALYRTSNGDSGSGMPRRWHAPLWRKHR